MVNGHHGSKSKTTFVFADLLHITLGPRELLDFLKLQRIVSIFYTLVSVHTASKVRWVYSTDLHYITLRPQDLIGFHKLQDIISTDWSYHFIYQNN